MALETAAAGQLPSPPDSTQHSHCGQAIRDPEVSYRGLLLLTAAKFLFILFPPVVCGASGRVLSEVTKLRDRRFGTPDAGAGPRPGRRGRREAGTHHRAGDAPLTATAVRLGRTRSHPVFGAVTRYALVYCVFVYCAFASGRRCTGGGVRRVRAGRYGTSRVSGNRRKPGPLRLPVPRPAGSADRAPLRAVVTRILVFTSVNRINFK